MNKIKQALSGESRTTGTTGSGTDRYVTADSRSSGVDSDYSGAGTATGGKVGTGRDTIDTGVDGGESYTSAPPSNPPHQHNTKLHSKPDANATHDHKHLAPVTRERVHDHEVEEVIREKRIDEHHHHIQHHVQPVLDERHRETVHEANVVPETEIRERHVNTDEDRALFAGLNKYQDEVVRGVNEKQIVDQGEKVSESHHHHVHHVVQPVIERDTHEHHTIHTTIPIHQTIQEAPIIHQSTTHEPVALDDFVKGGGKLDSTLRHEDVGVLENGECERVVDGQAEQLVDRMRLGKTGTTGTTGTTGATGTTGTTGTTGY